GIAVLGSSELGCGASPVSRARGGGPQPADAFASVVSALERYPLVALGERHGIQETYDFVTALLMRPELVGKLNDLVVECGNSLHQQLADRFVLGGELISNGELERIWRFTIGGGVLWDSPVYEQVFHTVRALNW